jgi:hypothetical protein
MRLTGRAAPVDMKGLQSEVEVLADGFRRTQATSDDVRWSGVRDWLADAAMGQGRAVREGLALLGSWRDATAIAPALFPAGTLRNTAASRRVLQKSLRTLGAPAVPLHQLAASPRGTPARVRGRILGTRRKLLSHIWFKGETCGTNVRLLFEEGHDFFLTESSDQAVPVPTRVLVAAAGGYLMGGPDAALDTGDVVEVFGIVDRVIDPHASFGATHSREGPLAVALRAGDQLPVIVWKIPRALSRKCDDSSY